MRKCGTCAACCTWPSIKELAKPLKTPCVHLHKQGFRCKIYEERPSACVKYRCAWMRGLGASKDRPGTCDILIDRRMTKWGYVLVAKQLKPFAAMRQQGKNAVRRVGRDENMLVLILDFDDIELIIGAGGPSHLVEQFQKDSNNQPVLVGTAKEHIDTLIERVVSHGR